VADAAKMSDFEVALMDAISTVFEVNAWRRVPDELSDRVAN